MFKPLDWNINDNYPEDFVENALGPVPNLINSLDNRQIKDQLNEILSFGWNPEGPTAGWQFHADSSLEGSGLPPVMPVAYARHGLEQVYVFPAQFIVISQLNGDYEVGRIV